LKKAKKITLFVMSAAGIGLIAWDIVAASNKERGDTISEILLSASKRVPVLAVSWGILTGHLFWPQDKGVGDRT
jgi:hypothetical protein